ncbi:hypothetical protein [Dactylosporangium sp. NPDC000521]|uniref:hypothetical protein n=1 Tax=Dactylosporangium sp. NPDC000521 TaxID=3363975 RepID=UPI0036749310
MDDQNPQTPDDVTAAGTGSSRRAQDGIQRLVSHVQARLAQAQGEDLPQELLDELAERERSQRADAAYRLAHRAFQLGREAAGATPFAGDLDPELADALGASTPLPRSELLPEVRRLVAERSVSVGQLTVDLVPGGLRSVPQDRSGDGVPEVAQAVVFALRAYDQRAHVSARLYAGPDPGHLALAGELRLRPHEYSALQDALNPPQQAQQPPVERQCFIEEPHAGHRWYADGTPLTCGGQV